MLSLLDALRSDLRQAARRAARAKASTAIVVFSLALGTGANAVVFSVLDALLFRAPAGIKEPDALVTVSTHQENGATHGPSSFADYESLLTENSTLASLAAFDESTQGAVRLGDVVHRVRIAAVTENYFSTLGMTAAAGRLLDVSTKATAIPPAVISHRLWTTFGQPPGIVGSTAFVEDRPFTIVGLAPERFGGLRLTQVCDLWIHLPDEAATASRGERWLSLIGRLRPGTDLRAAQADVVRVSSHLASRFPDSNRGTRSSPDERRLMTASAYSWIDPAMRQRVLRAGLVIAGAAGLLLVSACVNAAGVLLSRSAARRREIAVQAALGASRVRLVRQGIVEGLAIAGTGAVAGLLVGHWTAGAVPALFAPEQAALLDTRPDWRLLLGCAALACVAGAILAGGPAWQVTHTSDVEALRTDGGGVTEAAGPAPIRAAIVICQIALSTVLLIGSLIFVRALGDALEGDLGLDRGLAIALLRLPGDLEGDAVAGLRFTSAADQSVRRLSGAGMAGWVATLPAGRSASQTFQVATRMGVSETIDVDINFVSASYFSIFRLPVIEGRNFTTDDRPRTRPVVIVNEVLARRSFFPSALGRVLLDSSGRELEIVGVVRNTRTRTLQEVPEPTVYFPVSQREYRGPLHFVVRSDGDAGPLLAPLTTMLESLGPVRIVRTTTFEQHLAEALTLDRLATTLVSACGVWALLLATLGVYGVIGDAVRRRTREIGLRVALGADRRRVIGLVYSEALYLTAGGLAVGCGAALLLERVVRSFVYLLPSIDGVTLAAVLIVLTLAVAAAAAIPAHRALRISPITALRAE